MDASELLTATGQAYLRDRIITSFEIAWGHDIHAFYRLARRPDLAVHVQAYPGMSDSEQLLVSARLRDYNTMLEARLGRQVSVGNEHGANVEILPHLAAGTFIPYRIDALRTELEKDCEHLRG